MRNSFLIVFFASCAFAAFHTDSVSSEVPKSIDASRNRLTLEILSKIPDEKLEQAIVEYVETRIAGRDKQERQIVAKLGPGIQALYITWWLEAEVNNGGFSQYYWNSAGQFADAAPAAFDYFGARQHAALMREANTIRGVESAAMQKFKVQGSIGAFSASYEESKLDPLDTRYYKLTENLSALRIARIRAHPEDFLGSP